MRHAVVPVSGGRSMSCHSVAGWLRGPGTPNDLVTCRSRSVTRVTGKVGVSGAVLSAPETKRSL